MSQDTVFTDYREHDGDDLSLTVENDLESPPSLHDKPRDEWTNDQKETMWVHVQYYTDKTAEIAKC